MPSPFTILRRIRETLLRRLSGIRFHHRRVHATETLDFLQKYAIGQRIGEGTFGEVFRVTCVETGQPFAMKVVDSSKRPANVSNTAATDTTTAELELHAACDHPNIIEVHDSFADASTSTQLIVMELGAGGDLYERIVRDGHYAERDALPLMKALLSAVAYLHTELRIAHRDLKPENIMLTADGCPKLADFGHARQMPPESEYMTERVGTRDYRAPEVIRGRYTHACDVWSLGVIMYALLCGYLPFESSPVLTFPTQQHWALVSDTTKTLLAHMLDRNPVERLTCEQCLCHPAFAPPTRGRRLELWWAATLMALVAPTTAAATATTATVAGHEEYREAAEEAVGSLLSGVGVYIASAAYLVACLVAESASRSRVGRHIGMLRTRACLLLKRVGRALADGLADWRTWRICRTTGRTRRYAPSR
jgi:hypothetical protein